MTPNYQRLATVLSALVTRMVLANPTLWSRTTTLTIAYARVSTEHQTDHFSEAQRRRAIEYAKS